MSRKKLTGDCEIDCQETCAYPGQFSECECECECDTAPVTDEAWVSRFASLFIVIHSGKP